MVQKFSRKLFIYLEPWQVSNQPIFLDYGNQSQTDRVVLIDP